MHSNLPVLIDLQSSSRFVFRAYSETGEASEEVIASVNVARAQDGYTVTIDSVNQFTTFTDSCSLIWGVQDETNATWDDFVQFPYQTQYKENPAYSRHSTAPEWHCGSK